MTLLSRDGTLEASTSTSHLLPSFTSPLPSSPPHFRPSNARPPLLVSSRYTVQSTDGRTPRVFHIRREFHSMVAGAGAGLVSSIVTCPLDVIKTRLQAQHLARDAEGYEGVVKTCQRIWRQAGFRGFYRGLGPTLAGYLPTWGIYFTVYDLVKDRLGHLAETSSHPGAETTLVHVVAAMTAGATGTIMTNPLWVVKTRFMAQAVLPPSSARYRTTWDAIRTIYRTEGLRAFYKGLLPSLIGVSHVAVQFPLYEKAKSWAGYVDRGGDQSSLTPSTILVCSAVSKMVASLITYPHEVLRTRLQIRRSHTTPSSPEPSTSTASLHPRPSTAAPSSINGQTSPRPPDLRHKPPAFTPNALPPHVSVHPSIPTQLYSPLVTGSNPPIPAFDHSVTNNLNEHRLYRWGAKKGGVIYTFHKIMRQDGWRGFYRGLSINLVRTVPNSAVTMLTYELIMRNLS